MNERNVNALWSMKLELMPAANLAMTDDLLLVVAQSQKGIDGPGNLEAFRLVDGKSSWQYSFPELLIAGLQCRLGVAASDPFCFVTTSTRDVLFGEGEVVALDKNGQAQWQWRGGVQMLSAPTLTESQLAFTADSELFITLDPATGQEQMRVNLTMPVSFHAPRLHDDLIFIPGRGPDLIALNRAGAIQWQTQVEVTGWLDKTPVVIGENVITVSSQGVVVALSMADGHMVWQQPAGVAERPLSPPTTDGERIYVGARDGVYALAVADGRILWHFKTERSVEGQPVVDGRFLYATSHDHSLYLLEAATGDMLWQHKMERRIELPATVHKDAVAKTATIFIADQGGKVLGFSQQLVEPAPTASKQAAPQFDAAQLRQLAKQFEAKGQMLDAAQAYLDAGEKEQAAEKFEEAEKWLTAVKLWHELSRPLKEAQALEGQARSLEDNKAEKNELIAVWEQAALIYEQEGERARAEFCQRQVARYQQQPILDLNLDHDGLVLNAWASLQLTVKNTGYGRASGISVHESGDQFEGEVASSQYYFRLNANEEYVINLALRPLEYGKSVPLRLTLEYMDRARVSHKMQKTIYLPVARVAAERIEGHIDNIFSATVASNRVTTKEVEIWQGASLELERELRGKMVISFSEDELEELCLALDIEVEIHIKKSDRETRGDFALAIIRLLKRYNRLPSLIEYCHQERPHIDWRANVAG